MTRISKSDIIIKTAYRRYRGAFGLRRRLPNPLPDPDNTGGGSVEKRNGVVFTVAAANSLAAAIFIF